MATSRTRARVFTAAVGLYLLGISAAVVTGFPSMLTVSSVLVAASTWAFGVRLGLLALVLRLAVSFVLFRSRAIPIEMPTVAILMPSAITDTLVLLAVAALRRAEFRQDATEEQLREKNAELEVALAEVKELRGMLPICAWCKSVRDVSGMWSALEAYLTKHSRAKLTHGICPTCAAHLGCEVDSLPPTA